MLNGILDDPVSRTPAMMYLFHRVEERLDGSPAILRLTANQELTEITFPWKLRSSKYGSIYRIPTRPSTWFGARTSP